MLLVLLLVLIALPAWAAPIAVDIDKDVNLAIGTRNFGPVNIPNDVSVCSLSIDRTNWTNPSATISVSLSISVNNGPFVFWLETVGANAEVGDQEIVGFS